MLNIIGTTIILILIVLWTGFLASSLWLFSIGLIAVTPRELKKFFDFLIETPKNSKKEFFLFILSLIKYLLYFCGYLLAFCTMIIIAYVMTWGILDMISDHFNEIKELTIMK